MSDAPLSCTIKAPVLLTADVRNNFNSGCKVIDIIFPRISNPEVGEIRFKNSYVAFITVRVKIQLKEQNTQENVNDQSWRMAIKRFRLMPDPHAETGSHDVFSFTKKHFQCEMRSLLSMRIILQQPSPQWKDFKLEELKLLKPSKGVQNNCLPAFIVKDSDKSRKKELEGVPNLTLLSSCLLKLWALAEKASDNQTQQSLGKYDVDGCYDINLLSYS